MTNSKQTANDVRAWLRRGLLAARAGDHAEARRCFQATRDADPDNISALLWLAWLAPIRQESLVLLSRVLELEPQNERAHAGIRWARRRPASGEDGLAHPPGRGAIGVDRPPGTEAASPPWHFARDALRSPEVQDGARKGIAAQRARRLIKPLSLLLVAACLLAIGVGLLSRYSPDTVLALVLPTYTPPVTPTPTFTLTPTPSPTPTDTPSPTPTDTPSPMPTSTPLPTATPSSTPTLTPTGTSTPTPTHTPSPAPPPAQPPPPPSATPVTPVSSPIADGEKWIDVDLTHQRVTAYEGNSPVFQTTVSAGLPNTPTVVGQFRIYWKLSATTMAGPGYYLPNVPYTMYFYRGYSLHGTYWHNNFGQPMSHGCVNMRTEDAQWLFNWADPPLPAGASHVRSSHTNPGTLVVIHY